MTEHMFKVEMIVEGGVTYCVSLQQEVGAWIAEATGDATRLPAVSIESAQPREALRLRVTWIEIPGRCAWEAMTRAAEILAEGCPRLINDIALTVTAEVHDPQPYRRPQGA